jgi:hypothetical protein
VPVGFCKWVSFRFFLFLSGGFRVLSFFEFFSGFFSFLSGFGFFQVLGESTSEK